MTTKYVLVHFQGLHLGRMLPLAPPHPLLRHFSFFIFLLVNKTHIPEVCGV